MKQNTAIENLSEKELQQLIADLKDDIALIPNDEIDWDGKRGFYEGALRKAEAQLRVVKSARLTNPPESV